MSEQSEMNPLDKKIPKSKETSSTICTSSESPAYLTQSSFCTAPSKTGTIRIKA